MKKIFKLALQFAPYAVFILLAARVAITREFPLPFDEKFHFGIINFYAHHINPFFSQQSTSNDAYGALARDPSYLYQYLLSFPLRFMLAVHATLVEQVITLRLISIALGASTLYLVQRLARQAGLSSAIGYVASFGLAITPVFSDLSGQINYDNLLIPLILVTVLMTLRLVAQIRSQRVQLGQLAGLMSLTLLTSLVMYSYLPIMLAIGLYVGIALWRYRSYRLLRNVVQDALALRRVTQVVLVTLVVLSTGLWVQRYGVNIVKYHTPHPQCNVVLNVERCMSYGPWARNYGLHQVALAHPKALTPGAVKYFSHEWALIMYHDLFTDVTFTPTYQLVFSLHQAAMMVGDVVLGAALLWAVIRVRSVRQVNKVWWLGGLIVVSYVVVLWIQNFSDFYNLHQFIAVQGRYLLPILPFAYIAAAGVLNDCLFTTRRFVNQSNLNLLPVGMTFGVRARNQLLQQLQVVRAGLQGHSLSSSNAHKSYTLTLR
jgi:hypothetical protein